MIHIRSADVFSCSINSRIERKVHRPGVRWVRRAVPALLLAVTAATVVAQPQQKIVDAIIADGMTDQTGYKFLEELCDDFGGRLVGSPQNQAAMERTVAELKALGIEARLEEFKMPGWERGDDRITMLAPVPRPIRAASISYTQPTPEFTADAVDLKLGRAEDYAGQDTQGKIGVVSAGSPVSTRESIKQAMAHGVKALLFIDRVNGGQLLARSGSFVGEPLALPVFTITAEEGLWMQRLLARDQRVTLTLVVRSKCIPVTTANIVARFPGRTPDTVILGGHFDGWDLGQAALDNGLGIAQILNTARLLQKHSPENLRTVELVWFNGEEAGLWGSRTQSERERDAPIVAMINLDMAGYPTGVNAMGYDELMPVLQRFNETLGELKLKDGVVSSPWRGSDHLPYMLTGVRAITIGGPIAPEAVRFYHDFGDTYDKVDPKLVAASSSAVAALVYTLANDSELKAKRVSDADTAALLVKAKLDTELRNAGIWPFGDAKAAATKPAREPKTTKP
ncbi:M28 family peptidase [Horticoccus luteus]|uniref:Carboxypeptidase Q n=1 Tax=Horticoccus luteus TaxID=2862869 RepID=A0A8F9XGI8_9BACT|nr:M28 family peptidase [Horticoccus luteus]QYM79267.1 M28 family peptidase [Horticoccus luteus]